MNKRVWLSYDLGIDGDYNALLYWLDSQNAVECGDSMASFVYDAAADIRIELADDLKQAVHLRSTDRIYLIYCKPDGKWSGRFIHGRRKPAPWAGYAASGEESVDED